MGSAEAVRVRRAVGYGCTRSSSGSRGVTRLCVRIRTCRRDVGESNEQSPEATAAAAAEADDATQLFVILVRSTLAARKSSESGGLRLARLRVLGLRGAGARRRVLDFTSSRRRPWDVVVSRRSAWSSHTSPRLRRCGAQGRAHGSPVVRLRSPRPGLPNAIDA